MYLMDSDEIKIKFFLEYNNFLDLVDGFEDSGLFERA